MMTSDRANLVELEKLATKLRHNIARNPRHSRIDQMELEDLQQLIALRQSQLRHIFGSGGRTARQVNAFPSRRGSSKSSSNGS